MTKSSLGELGCVIMAVAIPLLIALSTFLYGWALSALWTWFVVPVFEVEALTISQSVGLCLVGFLFRPAQNSHSDDTPVKKRIVDLLTAILSPVYLVALGWIVKGFM